MTAVLETAALDIVIERMDQRLAEFASTGDRRERFLLMYRTFKHELRKNLQAGRFRDPEWSEVICCRMGNMYFEADADFEADPERCPAPWSHAFRSAYSRRTNLLQDMLLGMNAHINYDLPLCTFDTMERFGDVDELRQGAHTSLRFRQLLRRRYHDFLLINEIAWESIPLIEDVVCDRFNRLLKYANIMSFRFTRPIAERIICEYRDRAWAHTLVLLTVWDEHGTEATRRHLSLFALRGAGLVERLSLNPLRHLAGPPVPEPDPESMRAVALTLVRHLGSRPTRGMARQALTEYGTEVQPLLIQTLVHAPPLARVRAELYRILGAHPGDEAVAALADALPREREVRTELLQVLAGLQGVPVREPLLQNAMAVAREELADARETLSLLDDLGPEEPGGSLLDHVLRQRAHQALDRCRNCLRAIDRGPAVTLPSAADHLSPVPSLPELSTAARALAAAVGESPIGPEAPQTEEVAQRLRAHPDPWIRSCAVWWTAEYQADGLAVTERLRKDDHELVKETALRAAANLLPPEPLQAAAAALLERDTYSPDTPVRRLARQILDGEVTMITTIEKVLHLKNVELFQDVLAEDLITIARVAKEHRFKTGDLLIEKEVPGVAAYVVVDGTIDVRGLDGQELASVGAGGVLGEMSVVSDMPTSADCIAATKGLALRIARADFHALLQDHPTTAIGIMHVLAQRLRDTNRAVDVRHAAQGKQAQHA